MSVLPSEPEEVVERDPFDAEAALRAPEPLAAFNRAGVLATADIHVALTLGSLAQVTGGEPGADSVLLATALAVRAPRLGSVLVDLETISQTVAVESEELPIGALPWPEVGRWLASVSATTALVVSARTMAPSRGRCDCSARGSTSTATGARSERWRRDSRRSPRCRSRRSSSPT